MCVSVRECVCVVSVGFVWCVCERVCECERVCVCGECVCVRVCVCECVLWCVVCGVCV